MSFYIDRKWRKSISPNLGEFGKISLHLRVYHRISTTPITQKPPVSNCSQFSSEYKHHSRVAYSIAVIFLIFLSRSIRAGWDSRLEEELHKVLLPNSITRSNNCVSSSWGYFSQMYQLYPVVLRSTKLFFLSDLFWVLFVLRCSKFYFPPKKKDIVFLCHTKSYPEVVIQLINRLRVVLHNYTISISTDLQWGRKLMYNYVQRCKSFGGTSR